MPGKKPDIVRLFRIIHIDNVDYLLRNGMYTRHNEKADPDYINIGDNDLIANRNDYPVPIDPPNGSLGEYVPFYFGPLSPMLLKIKDGNGGIKKRPQSDIVYVICRLDTVIRQCEEWCFTDGHAKNKMTEFYNDEGNLDEIDWEIVVERYWANTEDDFDRMRRKQAEFLIKHRVPVECISHIIVFDEQKRNLVQEIIDELELNIKVLIHKPYYY